jgi:hypothetical protein
VLAERERLYTHFFNFRLLLLLIFPPSGESGGGGETIISIELDYLKQK